MGAWDSGPFDNDAAADWCADLAETQPAQRLPFIRTTLAEVAEHEGYLDYDEGAQAVAAAAILAADHPGGPPVDAPGIPEIVSTGAPLPDDLPAIAVRALDRVLSEDSEWRALWAGNADVLTQLRSFREALRKG